MERGVNPIIKLPTAIFFSLMYLLEVLNGLTFKKSKP